MFSIMGMVFTGRARGLSKSRGSGRVGSGRSVIKISRVVSLVLVAGTVCSIILWSSGNKYGNGTSTLTL